MRPKGSDYHSYLLRIWQVKANGIQWRATLEDVQSGERYGFADLPALQRYLAELADTSEAEAARLEQQPD